jgi:hypothetical protein
MLFGTTVLRIPQTRRRRMQRVDQAQSTDTSRPRPCCGVESCLTTRAWRGDNLSTLISRNEPRFLWIFVPQVCRRAPPAIARANCQIFPKAVRAVSQAPSFLLPATNIFPFRYRKNAIHSTAATYYHSVNKSFYHPVTRNRFKRTVPT